MSLTTSYSTKPARAETSVHLAGDRILRIVTTKAQTGHLTTRATVATVEGNNLVFALFRDFNETLVRSLLRATDGNVRRQHESVLATVAQLTLRANQFYELLEGRACDQPCSTPLAATIDVQPNQSSLIGTVTPSPWPSRASGTGTAS